MDKISEKIKAARIAKGVTIEEVAEATLLSVNIIKDIEDGAFERFVGDELYVKMYLKKIARYLEIDETIADDYYAITREIKKADLKDLENKKEEERVRENQNKLANYKQQYDENMSVYKEGLKKVEQLLTDYYSLNIIPKQYRNIQSIMYIYDYMQSSQEDLRDALFSNQINEGINKIVEKLDTIINNQGEMIMANRRIESKQQSIINQNNQMLNSFQNIEANTEESAYYSKLSAYYNAANAYYSYAKYLED